MKQKLLYSLLILFPFIGFAQDAKFKILPFINGITSIKEGQIEAGPELNWEKVEKGNTFIIRPSIRMPLTSKSDNILQIDRFSSTWRGILSVQYTKDNTEENGGISRHSVNGQFEYGSAVFKYYPTGIKSNEQKIGETSYAFELKYIGFFTKGKTEAKQFSPQFRLRYSYDWKAANEVGVVNPINSNGVITTSNFVVEAPSVKPTFSPAFSLQIYPGKGSFSYSPTIYYDFTGKKRTNNPFDNLNRLRLESWVFFYPLVKDNPNVKIGISPFLSVRTAGTDDFNKVEYGGMITVKFGTTFLQFF
ncbi:hypothetical protein EZ428_01250 [Pedobacter frigiditerrae]|uniref:MetA-pathway of phenol degradation n=1 Tax=Pedobacter frigiditerrae TaxID=2530452 RepID=A0A4R0N272_9SPHI|nr:hypothetical protein [Pedobacter frigiditerrae]TCC93427.1 hypothetical protein EZ428_01250 [Pedobacter frigiditerrae]